MPSLYLTFRLKNMTKLMNVLTLMACIQLILSLQRLKTVLLPLRQTAKDFVLRIPSTGVTGVRNTFQTDFDSF